MTDARSRAIRGLDGRVDLVASAPGRVNLIGEHTDYNDGFVLPLALPFATVIAARSSRPGSGVRIVSEGFGSVNFVPTSPLLGANDWSIHLRGVHALLADEGVGVPDWTGSIATDIPMGASLSSSAALEVTCIHTLVSLARVTPDWDGARIARLGQRVENEVLGLPSGIMDQLISATARSGHASLIDCRDLTTTHVRLPAESTVVVMDTGTRRELVDSEYAARREDCRRACDELKVAALRDATLGDIGRLDEPRLHRRARHVVTENHRTLEAASAMTAGDAHRLGELMTESHESLRDDYEVSGPALDAIVSAALAASGCLGARMTGGGFAGCAVALVETGQLEDFCVAVAESYQQRTGTKPQLWPVTPSAGASVEWLAPDD